LLRLGQKYLSPTNVVVLSTPKCPPKPFLCISLMRFSLNELYGMHNFLFLNKNPSWMWKSKYGVLSILHGALHAFQISTKFVSSAYNSFIQSKLTTSTDRVFNNITFQLNAYTTKFDFSYLCFKTNE
jgi:hypothetical protein